MFCLPMVLVQSMVIVLVVGGQPSAPVVVSVVPAIVAGHGGPLVLKDFLGVNAWVRMALALTI